MADVFKIKGRRCWYANLLFPDGKHKNRSTKIPAVDERKDDAREVMMATQRRLDAQRKAGQSGPMTCARWVDEWVKAKEKRGEHWKTDASRLRRWIVPVMGHKKLTDDHTDDVKTILETLKEKGYAPGTRLQVLRLVGTVLREANRDPRFRGTITIPDLPRQDTPKRRDHDPEAREEATYTVDEILTLTGDRRVAPYRRVLNAIKALGGLRHGEAAAVLWRDYSPQARPLAKFLISRSWDSARDGVKLTKTETPRRVPVHPRLAEILEWWHRRGYRATYGRAPSPDDLIVPDLHGGHLDCTDAARDYVADLRLLGLRIEAGRKPAQNGRKRYRGGHDLRSWFISHAKVCRADRDIIKAITHTKDKDVYSGYERIPWPVLCREVLMLRLDGGDEGAASGVLPVGGTGGNHNGSGHAAPYAGNGATPPLSNVTTGNPSIQMFESCVSQGKLVAGLLPGELETLVAAMAAGDAVRAAELASALAAPVCVGCGARHRPTVDCT